MIDERFVFVAIVFIFFGDATYLLATIKGKIKPNKVTWFLWALAPLVAYAAEASQQVGLLSLMTFAVGILPLFIFLASFLNRQADWKITKFDLACGALSLAGLLLWAITKVGDLAILFGIFADGLAAVPTVVKSYQAPETESSHVYLFNAIGAAITILTVQRWDFASWVFPAYIFLLCVFLFLLIKYKLGKKIYLYA